MNEVIKAIVERRSIRQYEDKAVPLDVLKQIAEAGAWAPSGMNKQMWHFTVIKSAETSLKLAKVVGPAASKPENYNFLGAPNHIVVSYKKGEPNASLDCGAAVQNILLAAHSLGVATCWINQIRVTDEDSTVRKMLTQLGVPEDHHVEASIALGYAKKVPEPHEREIGTIHFVD